MRSSVLIRCGYVDCPDGQLHYRSAGTSGPTIVLFHQTAASSRMYERLLLDLGDRYRLLAFDTPGFGASFQPAIAPTTADYVTWLSAGIDSLDSGSVHLVGHHTGAAIACELASSRPHLVRSLTMVGSLCLGAVERTRWRAQVHPVVPQFDGSHLAAMWHRVAHIDSEPIRHPPTLTVRDREVVDTLRAERWHEAYLAVFSQDFEAFLSEAACPIQLISGDEDILAPYLPAAAALRRDMAIHEISGGAYVFDDQPEFMATTISDFVDRYSPPEPNRSSTS